jgi:hypothetical protein
VIVGVAMGDGVSLGRGVGLGEPQDMIVLPATSDTASPIHCFCIFCICTSQI